MRYSFKYHTEVVNDIAVAKDWYSNQQNGLERRFAVDIKDAITRLAFNPYTHTIRYKNVRIAHPDIFPFSIHYFINEPKKQVIIIGVSHNSRDYEFLKRRI